MNGLAIRERSARLQRNLHRELRAVIREALGDEQGVAVMIHQERDDPILDRVRTPLRRLRPAPARRELRASPVAVKVVDLVSTVVPSGNTRPSMSIPPDIGVRERRASSGWVSSEVGQNRSRNPAIQAIENMEGI